MTEFEAIREEYRKQYLSSSALLCNVRDLIELPGLYMDSKYFLDQAIEYPTSEEQLDFCLTYLNLCKIIYNNIDIIKQLKISNIYNSRAFAYMVTSTNYQIMRVMKDQAYFAKNWTFDLDDETNSVLSMIMVELVGDDNDSYQELLIEFNLFARLFADSILPVLIEESRAYQVDKIHRDGILVGIVNINPDDHIKAVEQTYKFLFKKNSISIEGKPVPSTINYKDLTEYLVKFEKKINDIIARNRKN